MKRGEAEPERNAGPSRRPARAMATRSAAKYPSFRRCVEAAGVLEGSFERVTEGRDFLVGRKGGGNWKKLPTGCALNRGQHHQAAHWNRKQGNFNDKGAWTRVPGMPVEKVVAPQRIWMGMVFDTAQTVVSGIMAVDMPSLYRCSGNGDASSRQACTGLIGNTYSAAKCKGVDSFAALPAFNVKSAFLSNNNLAQSVKPSIQHECNGVVEYLSTALTSAPLSNKCFTISKLSLC